MGEESWGCWAPEGGLANQDVGFSSVQLLSHVRFLETAWTAVHQASLSITNSWSLLKLMSIKSVMPSNHLIPGLATSKFYKTKQTALTGNQARNLVTDWWWYQFASVLGLQVGTLNCNLWSLTHGASMLPGTLSQLGLQMCCDTGLPNAVQVWMLVKTQFGDIFSALSISLFC